MEPLLLHASVPALGEGAGFHHRERSMVGEPRGRCGAMEGAEAASGCSLGASARWKTGATAPCCCVENGGSVERSRGHRGRRPAGAGLRV
jgi:hypothetical protein